MNRSRIDKLTKILEAMREAERVAYDPSYAPWVEAAIRAQDEAGERLDAAATKALCTEEAVKQWNEETVKQLNAVLDDQMDWVLASLDLCGKPEPRDKMRWFRIFPDWFALIPVNLQLPALLKLQKETNPNWLDGWLLHLSRGRLSIPEGLSQEAMGIVIRTVLDNADALDDFLTYCKKCALLYPKRKHELSGILPSCPHCGAVEHVYWHVVA